VRVTDSPPSRGKRASRARLCLWAPRRAHRTSGAVHLSPRGHKPRVPMIAFADQDLIALYRCLRMPRGSRDRRRSWDGAPEIGAPSGWPVTRVRLRRSALTCGNRATAGTGACSSSLASVRCAPGGDARTRGRQQRAGAAASRRGDCSDSSDSAASGRSKRCARTAPLPRSRSLPRVRTIRRISPVTPGRARSSCRSPRSARAATSRASLSRAGAPSRRCSRASDKMRLVW
jgi:hypothetical protein